MNNPNATSGRITVVDTIYHQRTGSQPTAVESRFCVGVQSDEQPYTRSFKVGEEWKLLDHGWIDQCSMLLLSHDDDGSRQVQPTEEKRKELDEQVVELSFTSLPTLQNPDLLVPYKESIRIIPVSLERVFIRCRKGIARCTVTIFPK